MPGARQGEMLPCLWRREGQVIRNMENFLMEVARTGLGLGKQARLVCSRKGHGGIPRGTWPGNTMQMLTLLWERLARLTPHGPAWLQTRVHICK